jgi:hypothetical protein
MGSTFVFVKLTGLSSLDTKLHLTDTLVDVSEAMVNRGVDGNMAGERLVRSPTSSTTSSITSSATSARNPFRAAWSGPGFSYSINGEAKKISSGLCRVYQTIFERASSDSYYVLGILTSSTS